MMDGQINLFSLPMILVCRMLFISNFHLPYSTLLMMVAAFGGYDLVMKAYDLAVKEKYGFGTYGDAMLII